MTPRQSHRPTCCPMLPATAPADTTELLQAAGSKRVIRPARLAGGRRLLHNQAWDDLNLGTVTGTQARTILAHPHEWPTALVDRAIQVEAGKLEKLPTISQVAQNHGWFQGV